MQLIIHKEPNAIKDLPEKAVKGMNLNLNTLTVHYNIAFQVYLKRTDTLEKTTYNKIFAYSHPPKANWASYHHIPLL